MVFFFLFATRFATSIMSCARNLHARESRARESVHCPRLRRRRREQWKFLVSCDVIVTRKDGGARTKTSERASRRTIRFGYADGSRSHESETPLNPRDTKQCLPAEQPKPTMELSVGDGGRYRRRPFY